MEVNIEYWIVFLWILQCKFFSDQRKPCLPAVFFSLPKWAKVLEEEEEGGWTEEEVKAERSGFSKNQIRHNTFLLQKKVVTSCLSMAPSRWQSHSSSSSLVVRIVARLPL